MIHDFLHISLLVFPESLNAHHRNGAGVSYHEPLTGLVHPTCTLRLTSDIGSGGIGGVHCCPLDGTALVHAQASVTDVDHLPVSP